MSPFVRFTASFFVAEGLRVLERVGLWGLLGEGETHDQVDQVLDDARDANVPHLAPRLDGFILVNDLQRRIVKSDGAPLFPAEGRELSGISGAEVYEHCRVQVEELLAWHKAGASSRAILAVGGLTTVARARAAREAGADAAMVATAALVDPLLAVRFRRGR